MKKDERQPSLFAEPMFGIADREAWSGPPKKTEPARLAELAELARARRLELEDAGWRPLEGGEWREPPQEVFLSWSQMRQLAHCAARDLDGCGTADTEAERDFLAERGRLYEKDLAELKGRTE